MVKPIKLARIRKYQWKKQVHVSEVTEELKVPDEGALANVTLTELFISDEQYMNIEVAADAPRTEANLPSITSSLDFSTGEKLGFIRVEEENNTQFLLLRSYQKLSGFKSLQVSHVVSVKGSGEWSVCIHGVDVSNNGIFKHIPRNLGHNDHLTSLLKAVEAANVCTGNFDERVIELCRSRSPSAPAVFLKNGQVVGKEDQDYSVTVDKTTYFSTVRHFQCSVIVGGIVRKCEHCVKYRNSLRVMINRIGKGAGKRTDPSSTVPVAALTGDEAKQRLRNVKINEVSQRKKNTKNELKIRKLQEKLKQEGIQLPEDLHKELCCVLEEEKCAFLEGTAPHLLWEEQKKAANLGNAKQMRWHPMMVKWCLSLKSVSSSAYDFIRDSGFLALPSRKTLYEYEHSSGISSGIHPDAIDRLLEATKFDTLQEHQKNVSLLFDEVKIKSDLVYSKSTGELVGLVNLGSLNQQLLEFEQNMENGTQQEQKLATHILMFMVQGICAAYSFPVAFYPCQGFTCDQLYPVVWEMIGTLESIGFKVRAVVSDGASPNRRFYRLHGNETESPVYKTINMFADEFRYVYFIADPPHLVKTTRNCWENSGGNKNSRNMVLHGKPIRWSHLTTYYEQDLGVNYHAPGLVKLYKLTPDHIRLQSFSRMRVNLAAQVLSESVASALQLTQNPEFESTVEFIRFIDQAFDCFNVRHMDEGRRTRKPFREPYVSQEDWRFTWLKKTFLGWLKSWEDEISAVPNLTKDQRRRLCLSRETLEGWRITANSFPELCKELLEEPGVDFVLSERMCCQDRLEQHFSRHRRACGANSAPTVQQFLNKELSYQVTKGLGCQSKRGNCRGRRANHQFLLDNTPLIKKKRV